MMARTAAVTALPAPDSSRLAAGAALQQLLPQFVALTLEAKQAHWNVTGPGFSVLHAQTDELAASAREWSDRIAERILALGFHADARPATVAAAAEAFPLGRLSDAEVVDELVAGIDRVSFDVRRVLEQLSGADPVGEHLMVDALEGLEKYRWMLAAQRT